MYAHKSGFVIFFTDADTFTMLAGDNKQVKIRLHGIDFPDKKQHYLLVAKSYTFNAVFQKKVKALYKDIDRYGRVVAIIILDNSAIMDE